MTITLYPLAVQTLVPVERTFINALTVVPSADLSIVIHKTACGSPCTAQDVAQFFATSSSMASTHFVIGQDGTIVQCVDLRNGAGGNCCPENGFDNYWKPYLTKYGNLNLCTISIEHCDPTSDNSTPLTDAQKLASFKLVKWLVGIYGIPTTHIKTHASIDPVTRARCPGNYPMEELIKMATQTNISKAAYDTWNSTAFLFGGTPPPLNRGIAQSWLAHYLAGSNMPPPITQEFQSVDWSGNPIIVQLFAGLRCEWANGTGVWYKMSGGLF